MIKIKQLIERYNNSKFGKLKFLPIVYLTLGIILVSLLVGLIGLPKVWRIGLIFGAMNFAIAFYIGKFITKTDLPKWWSLFLPVVFAVFVFLRYTDYNYFFSGLYLLITWLGMNHQARNIYR